MKKVVLSLFVLPLITLFFAFHSPVFAFTPFQISPNNPMLSVVPSTWDSYQMYSPNILYHNGTYFMYFSGTDGQSGHGGGNRIGVATSTDAVHWTQYASNPVVKPNVSLSEQDVDHPSVIWDSNENIFKMWYTPTVNHGTYLEFYISYATSPDGFTWTEQGKVSIPQQAWEGGARAEPFVIKEGANDYRMWYTTNNGTWNISYATSTDGVNWSPYANNPVITGNTSWETADTVKSAVLFDGTTYEMYYTSGYGIVYASSTDGVTWTKPAADNPVLTAGRGAGVLKLPNGTTLLYYSYNGPNNIGLATNGPISTQDALQTLINTVQTYNVQQGIQNSLDVKLQDTLNALNSVNSSNRQNAINQMQAFISEVQDQSGNKLSVDQANTLISQAQGIIALLQ